MIDTVLRLLTEAGLGGLLVYFAYRLLDKWALKFLEAQQAQAAAMGDLARAVRDGQGEQREVLLAIRAMSGEVVRQTRWLEDIDGRLKELPCEARGKC